jgi:anaerobic magnesium-protoporphyrin IX monomethyl ester cyclase
MPAGARKDLSALPLEAYDGLYLRQGDLHIDNPSVHCPEDELDAFPMPYRADFDHAAYQQESLRKSGVRTTSIITTYGCPYDCDFCSRPVFGSRFRRRDLDRVMEEIEDILRLGYDSLWIADDSFTLDLRYLEAFCRRMEGRHISWSCLSRVDRIDAAIAGRMKAAGCRKVYLGLESGSQDVLTLMNKKATLEDGIRAVNVFHEAGVETAAFFIVGYPGETVESIEKTFALSLSLPLNEISFNVPFPLPGSRLFERVSELDISKDWDKENEVTFVYHSEFDEAWLRRRIEETLQLFENKTKH